MKIFALFTLIVASTTVFPCELRNFLESLSGPQTQALQDLLISPEVHWGNIQGKNRYLIILQENGNAQYTYSQLLPIIEIFPMSSVALDDGQYHPWERNINRIKKYLPRHLQPQTVDNIIERLVTFAIRNQLSKKSFQERKLVYFNFLDISINGNQILSLLGLPDDKIRVLDSDYRPTKLRLLNFYRKISTYITISAVVSSPGIGIEPFKNIFSLIFGFGTFLDLALTNNENLVNRERANHFLNKIDRLYLEHPNENLPGILIFLPQSVDINSFRENLQDNNFEPISWKNAQSEIKRSKTNFLNTHMAIGPQLENMKKDGLDTTR